MIVNCPPGHGVLTCEICRESIGLFRPERLALPLTSDMFESVDVDHGFPPPFPIIPGRGETMTWEFARCPYCRLRPFTQPDTIMTLYGPMKVGDDLPRPHTQEDDNQEVIDKEWRESEEEGMTLEERNQREIEKVFGADLVDDMELSSVQIEPLRRIEHPETLKKAKEIIESPVGEPNEAKHEETEVQTETVLEKEPEKKMHPSIAKALKEEQKKAKKRGKKGKKGDGKFTCPSCGEVFTDMDEFAEHTVVCEGKKK